MDRTCPWCNLKAKNASGVSQHALRGCPARIAIEKSQKQQRREHKQQVRKKQAATSAGLASNPDDGGDNHANFDNDELWPSTAQYEDLGFVVEEDVAPGEHGDLETRETIRGELPGPKPQALASWLPSGLGPDEVPPLVPPFLQWDEPPEIFATGQGDSTQSSDSVADAEENDLPGFEVPNLDDAPVTNRPAPSVTQRSWAPTANTETYVEATGRAAGLASSVLDKDIKRLYPEGLPPMLQPGASAQDHSYWAPFRSEEEYRLLAWFMKYKTTKGAMDEFFKTVSTNGEQVDFRNTDDIFRKLESIPYGIPNDQWETKDIIGVAAYKGVAPVRYTIHYRNVMSVIRFLIGHPAFKDHLTYAPVKHWSVEGNRIYNHMSSGNWWWDTQDCLAHGATVVPLLLASDKTVLTQHHGDKAAWPIYLTIGNLSNECRRSPSKPALILVGFVPLATKGETRELKGELYHKVMSVVLEPIKRYTRPGVNLLCADGYVRHCHPIIAGFMIDYEEQTIVAGVKNGQQCSICQIPPDKRENLTGPAFPLRTHDSMRRQIQKQQENPKEYPQSHDEWVQPWDNFAWEHEYVNIHEGMMIDKLHQLYKGIVKYTILWVQQAVDDWSKQAENKKIAPQRKKKGTVRDINVGTYTEQLDHRFRQVPPHPGLRVFNTTAFSEIKQWTGDEQKAIVRQMSAVLAPLLTTRHPEAMQFVRAVVDFVWLCEYRTHDDETLRHLDQALGRIDKLKEYFRDLRPKHRGTGEGQFNFPKFHVLVHYSDFIRKYGTLDGFDSATPETGHKIQVKEPWNRTNKRDNFLSQIARHSVRRINWIAMEGLIQHLHQPSKLPVDSESKLNLNLFHIQRDLNSWAMSVTEKRAHELYVRKQKRYSRPASNVARRIPQPDFIDALAVFVREMRETMDGIGRGTKPKVSYRREANPSWVETYPLSLHSCLTCWIKTGKDPDDIQATTKQLVRCAERWQNRDTDRQDFVWVQEYEGDFEISPVDGRTLAQLYAIVTVRDIERRDARGACREYYGCFAKTLLPMNGGQPNKVNGLINYKMPSAQQSRNPRELGSFRFYNASMVLRAAHVVPAKLTDSDEFLLNPYVDWGEYTEIYTLEWETETTAAAVRIAKDQLGRRNTAVRIAKGSGKKR